MERNRFKGFPPQAASFLRSLKRNNNRDWFQARKSTYEESVKAPTVELILAVGEAFDTFAPEMVADPRICLYRIYRDTRFSRDKTPYKTHTAAVFPVRGLPKNSGPGLYFHFSPKEVLVGGGMYMPDPLLLRAVREEIARDPQGFLAILRNRRFREAFGRLQGEQLKSMPKGFPADSPAADYLRYKQFLFAHVFPPQLAASPRLLPVILDCFQKGMPLIRFLKRAAEKGKSASSGSGLFSLE